MVRYVQGDDDAFSDVYDALAPTLRGFLLRRTQDEACAEDLVQHVFLKMVAARRRFCPDADVMPWAFAIARRLLIDSFRTRRRERLMTAEDELRLDCRPDTGGHPDQLMSHRRLMRRIEHELGTLPESHRVAFELVQLEGLTMAEAARALGTTVNAVKLRSHRAYEALRDRLGAVVVEGL